MNNSLLGQATILHIAISEPWICTSSHHAQVMGRGPRCRILLGVKTKALAGFNKHRIDNN